MAKFKVGDVVKRKDGKKFGGYRGDPVVETAIVTDQYCDKEYNLKGLFGIYTEDFIEFAQASPVKETTVVKKEIVPGIYGKVFVSSFSSPLRVYPEITNGLNKKELAEAIKTLQIIHEAMED